MKDSTYLPTLNQTASESELFMILAVENVAVEEVDVSMAEVAEEDAEEDVDAVEGDKEEEVVEEAAAHTGMELTSHM